MKRAWRDLGVALCAGAALGSCAPGVEATAPLPSMRILDTALLSELGPFHLRVFPKAANMRCDTGTGQVLIDGRRDLAALPGRNVQPAERCGPDWGRLAAMYGSASPVDRCMERQLSLSIAAGTYVVLVHGQGQFRRPTGETRSGIRGSGCAEVALGEGASRDTQIRVWEQADDRAVCGDGQLDSNETCDLGPMNGTVTPGEEDLGCSSTCQTLERVADNLPAGVGVGNKRHASVAWAQGVPLAVAWDVTDAPEEDVRARYFNAEGTTADLQSALLHDVAIGGGPSQQSRPALAPWSMGYVAAWETLAAPRNVVAETFDGDPPRALTPARYVAVPAVTPGGVVRGQSSLAASATRALVVWREGETPVTGLRASTFELRIPMAAPTAAVVVASGVANTPRAAALPDGTFVVVWSASGDVFARKLSAMGAPLGAGQQVNPVSAQAQDQPAVAALPDGTAVVAWRDEAHDQADGDGSAVRWVRLGADLHPMGDPRVAPTTTAGNQVAPAIAVGQGATPTILIVWEDEASSHIRGRLLRPDGTEVFNRVAASTSDFRVSDGAGGARHEPSAAAGGAAVPQFAVAWEAAGDATADIHMRLFPQ